MTVLEPVISFLTTCKIGVNITLNQVMEGADRPRKPVLRVMDRLVLEKYLVEIRDDKIAPRYGEVGRYRRNPTWELKKYPIYVNPKSPKRRTFRDRLWKAMRYKRRFTRKELLRIVGCSQGAVEDYTKLLEHHKIIRVIGKDSRQKVYMLVKDSGPNRPVLGERTKGSLNNA